MAKVKPEKKPSGGKGKERPDGQKLAGQVELLGKLYEVRIIEQLSWAELAETEYPKLTGGDTIDWRTLRQAMLRESMVIIPEMVNQTQKKAIDGVWDKIDMLKMIMTILKGRFAEWHLLHDVRIKSLMDGGEVIKFEAKELARLDFLTSEITGFFFRSADIMRDLRGLLAPLDGEIDGAAVVEIEGVPVSGALATKADLIEVIESVANQSQEMLQGIHLKHREEGRGHYRPMEVDDDHDDETDS